MKIRTLSLGFASLAMAAAVALSTGCTSVVDTATPGVNVYVRGELQSNFDRRFEQVVKAANRALSDLQFSNIVEKKDALVANLDARNADDQTIHVRIERTSDALTTVRIKVGRVPAVGDEKLSYIIYSKIKEAL